MWAMPTIGGRCAAVAKAETPAAANQSAPNFAMLTSWHNMVLLTTAAEDSLESALVPGSWREYRAQVIDLEGLPGPVAKAIAETVLNVKRHYRRKRQDTTKPRNDLPSRPGKVI